jgi:hypothetical protein
MSSVGSILPNAVYFPDQVEAGNKARSDLEHRAAADAATARARAADQRAAAERTRADLEARLAEASARGEGLAARCAALEAELAAKMAHAEQLAGKTQVCRAYSCNIVVIIMRFQSRTRWVLQPPHVGITHVWEHIRGVNKATGRLSVSIPKKCNVPGATVGVVGMKLYCPFVFLLWLHLVG